MRQHGKGLLREENMAFMNLHRCKIANFEDKINPHKHKKGKTPELFVCQI